MTARQLAAPAAGARATTRADRRRAQQPVRPGSARSRRRLTTRVRGWFRKSCSPQATGPGRLGWDRPGAGPTVHVDAPPEFRAPTVQVCGIYPFSAGGSLPLIGTPLGPHLEGRGVVCADPMTRFIAKAINNPSAFVLGRPGVGKSSLIRHIIAQLPDKGIIPMVLSDLKPDYVLLIRAEGGQVYTVGRGRDHVNPLDLGPLAPLIGRLPEQSRERAWADLRGRRLNVIGGLVELALDRRMVTHESNVLSAALKLWDTTRPDQVPVVGDLRELVAQGDQQLMIVAQTPEDRAEYQERTTLLMDALIALDGGSDVFGDVFAKPTTKPLALDRPVVFDLSAFDGLDIKLQAGVQLVCWSYGSAAVSAAKVLADAQLGQARHYVLVMDELWRVLRAAEFMVDRVDEIQRLNRTLAIGQILCTHTMDDLKVHSQEATRKAWGFVGRSEMVYLGGLNPSEMGNLQEVFSLSRQEVDMLTSWAEQGEVNPRTGQPGEPRGRAKFLLKVGKATGTPFRVQLTAAEREVNDTDGAWTQTRDRMSRTASARDAEGARS